MKADALNRVIGDLDEDDGYNCTLCNNKGFVHFVKENPDGFCTISSFRCECLKVRRSITRMQRSGLKNVISDYQLSKYETKEPWQKAIKDAALRYIENPKGWFFIGGQSGAGKTHICAAICREFLLSGRAVAYMTWRDDAVKLKGMVNDYEPYTEMIDWFKKTEVLYVDDLFKTGKSKNDEKSGPTSGDINIAFEILNYRYNNPQLLTIISSECIADDILKIDEAVGGRIYERAVILNLKPDVRRNYRLRNTVTL